MRNTGLSNTSDKQGRVQRLSGEVRNSESWIVPHCDPMVHNSWMQGVGLCRQFEIESVEKDERAFNFSEGSFGDPNRSASQFGLTVSYTNENNGEQVDDERCKRSKKSVVTVDKANGADRLQFDDPSDDEAVFFGSIGGLLAGVLAYAGLKRACNLIFGPEKDY